MQKDFLHVLPVEEVISRLLDVSPLPQESKRLDKLSGGPILAETIMATETLPPANRSGMDGYAVQASDLFGASEANPVWLDCVGEIAIDRPPNFTLQSGQCAAIVTGGYLPEGADAVIMVEHTKPFGAGVIEMRRSVAPGEYVMQKGDDAQEGTPLLERGTKLRAQEIGLLAALGITEVPVRGFPSFPRATNLYPLSKPHVPARSATSTHSPFQPCSVRLPMSPHSASRRIGSDR